MYRPKLGQIVTFVNPEGNERAAIVACPGGDEKKPTLGVFCLSTQRVNMVEADYCNEGKPGTFHE